jgi:quinohemoprotein amine dehydrogenase
VSVAADAPEGARDLFVAGAVRPAALVVYEKIDTIRITPGWNLSRSAAWCFRRCSRNSRRRRSPTGPTASLTPRTTLSLGPVEATWSVEEYTATFDDDDVKFVGEIDAKSGLFTPALDGPNPSRSGNRNNVGDVWVVATHALGAGRAPMRARAHLVVTVPLYMRWDFASLPR